MNTAAARLATTAAEVGTATVPKDQQSGTTAADLDKVSEVAVTGEAAKSATGITADTTKDFDTKEIPPDATTEVKATTATETSTKEPATKDTETVEPPPTEQTTATTAPVAEKAAAASTTKTEATKTEATKKDEGETASQPAPRRPAP